MFFKIVTSGYEPVSAIYPASPLYYVYHINVSVFTAIVCLWSLKLLTKYPWFIQYFVSEGLVYGCFESFISEHVPGFTQGTANMPTNYWILISKLNIIITIINYHITNALTVFEFSVKSFCTCYNLVFYHIAFNYNFFNWIKLTR